MGYQTPGKFARKILFYVSLVIFLYSCNDNEVLVSDNSGDLSYFPVNIGHWVEYEVDSIVHYDRDDFGEVDTAIDVFHFYIREQIDSSFYDGESQKTFVISRYRRDSLTLPWSFMNIWTSNLLSHSAQRVEDNVRFVRLGFPISPNRIWNGNAFNFFPVEEYGYEDLFEPMQINNQLYDSTVTVIQNDFVSLVNRISKKEIYAANVGMILKQLDSVTTRNTANGVIILNGLEYTSTITDYGN